jgi:hypothetical protein
MSAIDDKWHQIPWVGNPKDEGAGSAEMALPDGRGRARDFDNATIYWTPQTGPRDARRHSCQVGQDSMAWLSADR